MMARIDGCGRREFLGMAAVLAGAKASGAQGPEKNFPTSTRDRLAVATYPFRHQIGSKMTLEQFAKTIPGEFNVRGIEPWGHHVKSTAAAYIRSLRESFDAAGVHVVNLAVDISGKPCGSGEERSRALAEYHKWVDAAVILGSPSIRVPLPGKENGAEPGCAVGVLKALAEYGEAKEIVINLENDDPKREQPERVLEVIQAVNSPWLRSLPDFCNSMLVRNDQKYNLQALRALFPLAYNISHVKASEQSDKKMYYVDVEAIFAVAKASGYRGYFAMEFDQEGDPYEPTKKLIEASLRSLG
jgi:sugar phosphate isomerase/epimerase